jgi:hypothetical protein
MKKFTAKRIAAAQASRAFGQYHTKLPPKKRGSAPPPKNEGPRRDRPPVSNRPWWEGDGTQTTPDGPIAL